MRDRRFYSCVANMVLLPTPLKAFTDTMPEVKAMLRICSRNLHGWTCDHDSLLATVATLDAWDAWEYYPASWPRSPGAGRPLGTVALTPEIERTAATRRSGTVRDPASAGPHYPREGVRAVLAYRRIAV